MLFNLSLREEKSFPLLGDLFPLLRQGSESFLPETPELLRALLDIHSRLRDECFSGCQLGLSGAVERQQLPQQLLLLRLVAAAAWRVDQR